MCTPGASSDSFPDTEPFGFNSATYFLPMCTLIGVALSSIFIGGLSDKLGRKILLLVLGWVSAAGSVIKCKLYAQGGASHANLTRFLTRLHEKYVLGVLRQVEVLCPIVNSPTI